jgi:CTD small phosphatase-like protein 2
MIIVDNVAENF